MTDIHNALSPEDEQELRDDWSWLFNEDGSLNERQALAELCDYRNVMDQVPTVYLAITGGIISKPNTRASVVLEIHEQLIDSIIQEALDEEADLQDDYRE